VALSSFALVLGSQYVAAVGVHETALSNLNTRLPCFSCRNLQVSLNGHIDGEVVLLNDLLTMYRPLFRMSTSAYRAI
jgi:hypothetical protein